MKRLGQIKDLQVTINNNLMVSKRGVQRKITEKVNEKRKNGRKVNIGHQKLFIGK